MDTQFISKNKLIKPSYYISSVKSMIFFRKGFFKIYFGTLNLPPFKGCGDKP